MRSRALSRFTIVVALSAGLVLLSAGLCSAANFSADMVMTSGKSTGTGKLYVSGTRFRQEMSDRNRTSIIIACGKSFYFVDPARKSYTQTKWTGVQTWRASVTDRMFSKRATRKVLGTETISGLACEKVLYTSKQNPSQQITIYIAKSLDLPVRTEIKSEQELLVAEFKNIKKTTPPASLFQIPKGYKKVAMPTKPPVQPAPGK